MLCDKEEEGEGEEKTAMTHPIQTKDSTQEIVMSPDTIYSIDERPLYEKEDLSDVITSKVQCCCCDSKYGNALKHCQPWRSSPETKTSDYLPSNSAGLCSFISLTWLTSLMLKAYKKGLHPKDLWVIHRDDGSQIASHRLNRLWEEENDKAVKGKRKPELHRAVWRLIRTRVLVALVISIIQNILQFLGPSVLLKVVLDYINDPIVDHYYAAGIVIAIFMVNITRNFAYNLMFVISAHSAARVIGGVQGIVYKKILMLRTGGERLSGQVINIMSNDTERLFEATISCITVFAVPVLLGLSAIYAIYLVGPWAILGLVIYALCYPIMGLIAKAQSRIRLQTVKLTDERVTLMSEVLNSMRLIKMYSWEEAFSHKIKGIRYREMSKHKLGAFTQAVSSTVTPSINILATVFTLLGYTLSGYSLTAAQAFTVFSVFNAMQFSVGAIPYAVQNISEAKVSLTRIQKLLGLPEHNKAQYVGVGNDFALQIKNATFAWEVHNIDLKKPGASSAPKQDDSNDSKSINNKSKRTKKSNVDSTSTDDSKKALIVPKQTEGTTTMPLTYIETLFNINLSVQHGKLIGICGSIGSGKSSLVSAICGDLNLQVGEVQLNGKLALVSQQAWIINETLRENILVGQKYEEKRYSKTIDVCALKSDLEMLPNGDLTEIGERGVNLSGGQKQRVNLGRAVFSDRDIYLLDDPLSAVDTRVALHIFDHCIKGLLKNKTILLITHATHFLEKCDEIFLFQDGRILEHGTHNELLATEGEYFNMVGFDSTRDNSENVKPGEIKKDQEKEEDLTEKINITSQTEGKLIQEEGKLSGSVSNKVYLTLIKVSGGWCICSIILLTVIIFTLARLFNSIWLQVWLDAGDGLVEERRQNVTLYNLTLSDEQITGDILMHPYLWLYQLVYGLGFIIIFVTGIIKSIGVMFRLLVGASKLHNAMFNTILNAPMSFFDTTPSGRILNRFSRNIDDVDVKVPMFLEYVLQGIFFLVAQIIMVCCIYPWFILPLIFIATIFITVDVFLNAGVREFKRLDSTLKSPVVQHLSASISGLSIIRSYDKEKIFINQFYELVDKHSIALMVFRLSNRWFTFRMDALALLITLSITIICVVSKGTVSTAIAGLALSTINGICVFAPFIMRMKSEFQARVTSVERIMEYAYDLPSESSRKLQTDKPKSEWPSVGEIVFKNVKLRYRPNLPLVLQGINANIAPAEKIGIVGRTGAGKSSLIISMLRLVELDSGSIMIDGIDHRDVGLHTLRSAISVIPQDPVLFQGTIRYNLDPFSDHNDEEVWSALERSHLKALVQKLDHGLLAKVEAAGENFSVGERQLICLTRALLRNSKILLLDEATASVDIETDHLIQIAIREAFISCTVLTIAHRLNTVASYDRIMVLDAGQVKEFDTPENLMCNKESVFHDMMRAMGVNTLDQMKALS